MIKSILILLLFSLCTRLISLTFLPNYDEWYYLASWNSLQNGGILYKTILDNKPPLAYFVYAIPNILSLYVTLCVLSAVISYFIYKIVDNFYAGIVFLCLTSAIPSYLELNLEYWILACIIPAYYYVLKKENILWHQWAYFLFGASIMIKQHSLLLLIPILSYHFFTNRRHFLRSVVYVSIIPILCLLYLWYKHTLYEAYVWIIEFNFWYKDLSETGGYIWKRFIYGQLFALPIYIGVMLCIDKIRKTQLHYLWVIVLILAISSAWIGRQLYLHYQILIFPFLIILFYQIARSKYQRYVHISIFGICIFGQINYVYAYTYQKTKLSQLEGVISYSDKKNIIPLQTHKHIVFSAQSTLGLNYHQVKYIALCRSLEYLKKQNNKQKPLLTYPFYLKNAIYVVSKSCFNAYVGDLKYKIVYEYQDNIGIELEHYP